MRITFALLADEAVLRDTNLVDIIGGGWRRLLVESFPARVAGYAVALVEPSPGEDSGFLWLKIDGPPEGQVDGFATSTVVRGMSDWTTVPHRPVVIPFSFVIPGGGMCVCSIRTGDDEADSHISIPFLVDLLPSE